ANALQRHISSLRGLFGPESIERRGNGYALCLDESSIDVHRFESLDRHARAAFEDGDMERARALFDDALRVWRGDALSSLPDAAFALPEVTRLAEARTAAFEARVDAALELGASSTLIGELERLVAKYPLHERFRAQLMLALARSGRQAEALRAYQS